MGHARPDLAESSACLARLQTLRPWSERTQIFRDWESLKLGRASAKNVLTLRMRLWGRFPGVQNR